ncbi:AbgT family transporter [Peptoniphilus equinus]|uniref:AbgT family transporter n=1 Tax=Peptoniphilus equinus TaxID=3016343 RepID=A0ABY7QUA9_9FIRM|nr:Na+/H+ antiporter NhaC family protein [Peptoniphilus equinus]WBW50036.1 AbgT family transporter [Peptoniphilus equinus]
MNKSTSASKPKGLKGFKVPHSLVILMAMVLIVWALTYIIPSGEYTRIEIDGKKFIDPASFQYIESHAVKPWMLPVLISEAFISNMDLLLMIMFSGAAFYIITNSGAFQAMVSNIVSRAKDKGIWVIPFLTLIFGALCTTIGVNTFIAFTPITVLIAYSLGLDSLVGASIIILGGAVGFSTGMFQPSTTLLSQSIAGLPAFSGLGYRFAAFVVFLVASNVYLMRYAFKIKKDPTLSPVYEIDKKLNVFEGKSLDDFGAFTPRKALIIIVLFATMALIVYGGAKLDWDMREIASAFLVLAIVEGFLAGSGPSAIAKDFTDGVKKMMGAVLIIGIARSIGDIMEAGMIIDTTVHAMTNVVTLLPKQIQGLSMLTTNYLINLVLTSGSGQAAVVMPVFLPVADAIGMSRQAVITAFCFGDGFGNYMVPTSSALMGILGAANIPYEKWISFFWKLFVIWYVLSAIFIVLAPVFNHV